jgi:tetratricopeptide (TPR) repeat protein
LADALLAWGKIDQTSRADIQNYFRYFVGVFESPKDQGTALAQLERRSPFAGWALYHASMLRLAIPGLENQASSSLNQLGEAIGLEPALSAAVWSAIGANAYRQKDYENALKAFQRALAATPDDPELNNNVAYTLGVDLKRANDALPFAQAAAKAAPGSPMILDTLGALYHSLGQNEEARPVLERAVNLATTPVERVPALLHLSKTLFALEDRARARHFASLAEQFIKANPYLTDHYGEELKKLLQTLDGQ